MNRLFTILLACITWGLHAQVQLTIENVDSLVNSHVGYDIPRTVPTHLVFKMNVLRKTSTGGYVLRCGDDSPVGNSHNLDGAVIQGNKFDAAGGGGTHGLMLGFNVNYDVKHNYVRGSDYGMVVEGDTGMEYTAGGIAYNIIASNRNFGILLFGPDKVKIYNNTFFSDRPRSSLGLLNIGTNTQHGYDITTLGTIIKNNIFYAKQDVIMIAIDSPSLNTLDCDYNLYFSEAGNPVFRNDTEGITYSWSEWRALGFDKHSMVLNPKFTDTENFVPQVLLDFGTNLGAEYSMGLTPRASWKAGTYPETMQQKEQWQVGAILLDSVEVEKQVQIFPNPNEGLLSILLEGFDQNEVFHITLISSDGKFIYRDSMSSDEKMKQLNLSHLGPGLYIIRLYNDTSDITQKFIKLIP